MKLGRIAATATLSLGALLGSSLSGPPAQAAYTVTLVQHGPNVLADGSGSLDLTDLTLLETESSASEIISDIAVIFTGRVSSVDFYSGISGTTTFGSAGQHFATTGSGGLVGVNGTFGLVAVPHNYAGTHLSDNAIYVGATLATLGVMPGTYVWTWGTGEDADSFTLDVPRRATVPEPSGLLLLSLGLVGVVAARRYRNARD